MKTSVAYSEHVFDLNGESNQLKITELGGSKHGMCIVMYWHVLSCHAVYINVVIYMDVY